MRDGRLVSVVWMESYLIEGVSMGNKTYLAIVLSSTVSLSAYGHESDRIKRLEKRVQELERQVLELETTSLGRASNKDGSRDRGNWRKLYTGMSMDDVEGILGEPDFIQGGRVATWLYESGGYVMFHEGLLEQWMEPSSR